MVEAEVRAMGGLGSRNAGRPQEPEKAWTAKAADPSQTSGPQNRQTTGRCCFGPLGPWQTLQKPRETPTASRRAVCSVAQVTAWAGPACLHSASPSTSRCVSGPPPRP